MTFSQEALELNIQGIDSKLVIPEFNTPAQKWSKTFQTRPGDQYEAVTVALLENRGLLLFDRHSHMFVLSSKTPLEALIGSLALIPVLNRA